MNKSSGATTTRSNFYNSHKDAKAFLYHSREESIWDDNIDNNKKKFMMQR